MSHGEWPRLGGVTVPSMCVVFCVLCGKDSDVKIVHHARFGGVLGGAETVDRKENLRGTGV